MRDFAYAVAERVEDAVLADGVTIMPIAGGTELLNWCRLGIAEPTTVIDLGRVPDLNEITQSDGRLSIGALATLNEIGEHDLVRAHATLLSQACLAAASAQIRNRATIGGNVLQKTRCAYFRAEEPLPWACNKRQPGSGCAARVGLNERHALFGWTDECVATQPSDPVVALAALDAQVVLVGRDGRRTLPVTELHLTQEEAIAAGLDPARAETRMAPGEVIIGYHVPVRTGQRSAYVKVRERASYEYALVSAAAVIELDGARITRASIALGSVAQKPWRLPEAEQRLVGLEPSRETVFPVLRAAMADARPLSHNRYKIAMAAGAAVRAIVEAAT